MTTPTLAGTRAAPIQSNPLHEDARAALAMALFHLRSGNAPGAKRKAVQALAALAAAERKEVRQ